MISNALKIKGFITVEKGIDAIVTQRHSQNNLIVIDGRNFFAQRIFGPSTRIIRQIGIGSSSTAASISDVDLLNARSKRDIEFTEIQNNVLSYIATFPEGIGTGTIREVGLFASDGTMLCRSSLQVTFNKTEVEFLNVTWKLQIG